jgi:uncharacterized membrane protein YphA (DoxX/SURF4 family)
MNNNLLKTGQIFFAAALIGFGGLQMATGHLSPALLPFPAGMAGIAIIARITGIIFILAGICIAVKKMQVQATIITGMLFLILVLYPHLPKFFSNLHDPGEWVGFLETLALACGSFMLAASFGNKMKIPAAVAKYIFAAILIVFGIQHIMYEEYIETLIPAWLPAITVWSWLVMAAFFLTALSIIIHVKTRLALNIAALMFLVWVFILHLPRVINTSSSDAEWMSMFIALAMSGICFIAGNKNVEPREPGY